MTLDHDFDHEDRPDEANDEAFEDDDDARTLPETLPPPIPLGEERFPVGPLGISLVAALVVGIVAGLLGQFIWFYWVYSWVIGIAAAFGLQNAFQRPFNVRAWPLALSLMISCCVLAFVASDIVTSWFLMNEVSDLLAQDPEAYGHLRDMSQFDVLLLYYELNTFMGDAELGFWGNVIVRLIEIAIAVFYGRKVMMAGRRDADIMAVPPEAIDFVTIAVQSGMDEHETRAAMAARGWTSVEDQTQAMRARELLIQKIIEQAA